MRPADFGEIQGAGRALRSDCCMRKVAVPTLAAKKASVSEWLRDIHPSFDGYFRTSADDWRAFVLLECLVVCRLSWRNLAPARGPFQASTPAPSDPCPRPTRGGRSNYSPDCSKAQRKREGRILRSLERWWTRALDGSSTPFDIIGVGNYRWERLKQPSPSIRR